MADTITQKPYSFRNLLFYFLRLGSIGFGGPIALVGFMERDLVEARGWLTREEFLRGLALAQLAPGPLAAQLAMYIGFVKNGFVGTTLVGVAFILPSFLMVVVLGVAYVAYGELRWMQALFYGIGAGAIAIIAKSAYRLARLTLKSSGLLWTIFVAMLAITAVTHREIAWLFLLSGLVAVGATILPRSSFFPTIAFLAAALPAVLKNVPVAAGSTATSIFLFFAQAGAFVFGSGLAIVPYLYGTTVAQFHWLTDRQFLDAVAVAMITPGPVVITVGFIGYLVDGMPGAIAASLGVFLPVYLVVLGIAPFYERIVRNPRVHAFVEGVTAAAAGAIAGAVMILAQGSIVDVPTALIAIGAMFALVRFKIPEPILIAAAGCAGLLLYHAAK